MSSGKVIIIRLIAGETKKISLYKISNFPEPDSYDESTIKFELGLSNYATKPDIKDLTGVDTPDFAKTADLASLKSNVHKLDVDKPKTFPNDLCKLSNVVVNDIVKKTVYDELAKNIRQLILTKKVLKIRLKMLIKRYLIPINLLRIKTLID